MKNFTKVNSIFADDGFTYCRLCRTRWDSPAADHEYVEPTYSFEEIDDGQYVYDTSVGTGDLV